MYKTFKIEWPDNYGPEWLCKENLESCLFSETFISNTPMTVSEVKREQQDSADKSCGYDGGPCFIDEETNTCTKCRTFYG